MLATTTPKPISADIALSHKPKMTSTNLNTDAHMTPFQALIFASGLSYAEAGELLGVNKGTVRDWARGKTRLPEGRLAWAHARVVSMLTKADTLVDALNATSAQNGAPATIQIAVSTDDDEARLNGFSSREQESATIGLALAQLPLDRLAIVKLVPRGSTVATAAAEAARLA
ncbi:MAG: hypothetical protein RLZZ157_75 [Pseudomonadota bacterium]|jgi:transcriptional regulator with XRE-family HTH domain